MVKYFYNKYQAIPTPRYSVTGRNYSHTTKQQQNTELIQFTDGTLTSNGQFKVVAEMTVTQALSSGNNHAYAIDAANNNKAVPTTGGMKNSGLLYYYESSSYLEITTSYNYTMGSLIQSNLVAENGTYPENGRHTDGYWYVRGSVANSAPIWATIPAQTVRKGIPTTLNLASYASDADRHALTFTASSSNTAAVRVSVSGSTLSITGVAIGSASITVIANDGNGGATSTTFTATCANTGPVGTIIPNQTTKRNSTVTINLNNYFSDVDNDVITYTASSANTNIATVSVSGNILTIRGVSIGSVLITVTASDSKLTASQSFTTTVTNSVPTVAVTAPAANVTLYENDLFNLAGQAVDVDANQSVTVYAQINNDQRIVLAVGLSNAPVTFNKSLKFVGGQLFDGEVAVSGNLIDGVEHTVKIWAQDGDGAQSSVIERTFYTVPNRPPTLTVDTVQPSGIINTDKFVISGTAGDPDGNTVTAAYRVNGGNSTALEITEGRWAFDIALAQLVVGQNIIIVELVDSYNFKVSKTIKLNKNEVKTPILHSVARYKIEPPKGSAKGVLLYIQRDKDLTDLTIELSMAIQGEQENFVKLTSDNTAPISEGIVEDEFYFEADEEKNHIILKLTTTRTDINIDHKIHLISGVLE